MNYQQCSRCVMDTTADNISFDENGYCNYCTEFLNKIKHGTQKTEAELQHLISQCRKNGQNKKYDCLIGISGGVDSSYVLVQAIELGLHPLVLHVDNGWNTELSKQNVQNLTSKLGVDLITYKIPEDEYNEVLKAFLKANVLDVELLFDHIMLAANFYYANKFGIKNILSGANTATEGIRLPSNWYWFKQDSRNIKNIAKQFGAKLKTIKLCSIWKFSYFVGIKGIKWVSFPDYLPSYNKQEALDLLIKDYNYTPYPYKHYESLLTRFYQGYILPEKFGVDKRKAHLSTLILTNQMTRDDALKLLKEPPYPSQKNLQHDKEKFVEKLNWTINDLIDYINTPQISHKLYGSDQRLGMLLRKVKKILYG